MALVDASGRAFSIVTAPARLVGRFRPDLAASIQADARTFAGGGRAVLFSLLAVVAVVFPIVIGVLRATTDYGPGPNSDLDAVLNPAYLYGYTESVPYMLIALALGIFSPALGVLFVLVHAPVDLLASGPVRIQPLLTPFEWAVPARLLSDAILWIGVVEAPLLARRLATWVIQKRSELARLRPAVLALAVLALSFAWQSAAFWLVMPVFSWTVQGGPGAPVPLTMVLAVFGFGWIVLAGATLVALISGLLWRGEASPAGRTLDSAPRARGIGRELIWLAVMAFLLAGLMLRPSETTLMSDEVVLIALIVGGLVVAGPVLTRLLPLLPVPGFLARLSLPIRWVIAVVVAFAGTYVAISLTPVESLPDYLLLAVLFAITAPVVRIIVDAGRVRSVPEAPSPLATALMAIVRLVVVLAIWLMIPMVALAENESGMDWRNVLGAAFLMTGIASFAIFGLLGGFSFMAGKTLGNEIERSNREIERDIQNEKTFSDINQAIKEGKRNPTPRSRK